MKKLIPALCLLLISAVVMSTASFAWFSMNTSVTADGMSVTALSDGGLAIAAYTKGEGNASVAPQSTDFGSSASAKYIVATDKDGKTVASDLKPTSFDGTTWYAAEAADVNSYKASTATGKAPAALSSTDGYFLLCKYQIKSMDSDTDTNKATLSVSGITVKTAEETAGSEQLNKALRIAIVCDGKTYFFAPNYASKPASGTFNYITGTTPAATAYDDNVKLYFADFGSVAIYNALTTTAVDVDVYIYYEGEDEHCASVYAVNVDTISVELSFTSKKGST